MSEPIDLYYWPTPNGWKISIFLEETGIPYQVIPIDIGAGDQFQPNFLQVSPNNKMPAIVDPNGPGGQPLTLFESGAILLYLAEKTGQLIPSNLRDRYTVIQWLMFQMGGVGPMLGQAHHFRQYAPEQIPYAVNRYTNEATRLYRVLEKQLSKSEFIAGEYSIADIAIFPWIVPHESQGQDLADYPNLKRWFETIHNRPAVQRGLELLSDRRGAKMDDKAKEALFGSRQLEQR
ncbi:glutathione S-transferase N-terminal domain-containing protein [Desertifilum sp. FACHB-1129]|uniref:Glutathione S-transferase n=1 Tax=Desertifilum tharense IPPAS B-1220 TaxID=1781255 RepID=A0A1E5QNV1_9CYAN|nr:glutathione S-transferase N-terminal domain-containing protein [Desertifilum tharense]MBD2311646.1 glutathione S-transferase N-terminal domain-containing protein [Desertifilum sp. FACHB-1129]MBD2322829.1 glutathione S-transferase N-terminal domain-containing protein [Desertifilum sp. FACHB-866]MBD2332777.1 glutathione S-transferase N-terminal domain-containing protein [Desertifilum sp. FACHB-868]MDA0209372.1 glutathione S-transferase N-terminal domain-containing protein [Cyanobacteria bacter